MTHTLIPQYTRYTGPHDISARVQHEPNGNSRYCWTVVDGQWSCAGSASTFESALAHADARARERARHARPA